MTFEEAKEKAEIKVNEVGKKNNENPRKRRLLVF